MKLTWKLLSASGCIVYARYGTKNILALMEYEVDPGNDAVDTFWDELYVQWDKGESILAVIEKQSPKGITLFANDSKTAKIYQKGSGRIHLSRGETSLLLGNVMLSEKILEFQKDDVLILSAGPIASFSNSELKKMADEARLPETAVGAMLVITAK